MVCLTVMKPRRNSKWTFFTFLAVILSAGYVSLSPVVAEDYSDMTEEERQEELEKLDEKWDKYNEIVQLKQKQASLLSGQVVTLLSKISALESQIREQEREMEKLADDLTETESGIAEKERLIDRQKEVLSGLIREYHAGMDDDTSIFLAADTGNSDLFLKKEDWMAETGERIRALLHEIESTKVALVTQRDDLTRRKTEVETLKDELHGKNEEIATLKSQKETQLADTRTQEQQYQEKLARIEEQKAELLNFGDAENLSEIFASVSAYDTPDKKYWASTSWYYSQHDSRWGDEKIGNSKSDLANWGCAVTSVAMAFTELGSKIDPGTLANKPIYSYDLINWPASWSGGITRVSSIAHGNVSWSTIDRELKDGNPVIVYIKRSRGGGHYVVIHHKDNKGRYVVHDPYFGPNLFLDTSRSLVGKLGTNSLTSIDQMIIYND